MFHCSGRAAGRVEGASPSPVPQKIHNLQAGGGAGTRWTAPKFETQKDIPRHRLVLGLLTHCGLRAVGVEAVGGGGFLKRRFLTTTVNESVTACRRHPFHKLAPRYVTSTRFIGHSLVRLITRLMLLAKISLLRRVFPASQIYLTHGLHSLLTLTDSPD